MRNIRMELLGSHLLLAMLMLVVMTGGVISMFHLGHSIDRILQNNYKSVIAAQNMKETLERQDSSATFYLAGQAQKARNQYRFNLPLFNDAFRVESHNITEKGEGALVENIRVQFKAYTRNIQSLLFSDPPMTASNARRYYFNTLEPEFVSIKQLAQDILDLNQRAIVRADRQAKRESQWSSWTGVGVTLIAFLIAILFAIKMINLTLLPLRTLARQAEEVGQGHLNQRIELRRNDEIGVLAESFNNMATKLQQAKLADVERLHRAERMSDAAIDSLYDPVIVTDSTGHVVHLNHAAEGLFGPSQHATGLSVQRVTMDERIANAIDDAIHNEQISALEGEAGFIPLQVMNTQRTYRLRATPMRDETGTLLGAVAVLEDMTHLRELDRLKTEFIGVASHELRTPVTSLLLSVQLLQEGSLGKLTPEQEELINAQREDLDRLERMMRELLELSRLESGVTPPRFEIISPVEVTTSAIHSIQPQADIKNIKLEYEYDKNLPYLRADRTQLSRALVNLLANAIRHTPSGGSVRMIAVRKANHVTLRVEDTGCGIPKEFLDRIFDRFVQVPGATKGGAGLGLTIVKTIVTAHNGEIVVTSEEGKGSAFEISLPILEDRKELDNVTDTGH
jgi:NtrC-family two-component system sensor histidine kinase KinB